MLTTSQVSHGVTHYRHLGLSLHKIDTQRTLIVSLIAIAPNGRDIALRVLANQCREEFLVIALGCGHYLVLRI
jgi:hypothetical protein